MCVHLPKTSKLSPSKPIRSESKRPPLVSDRDHILAWQFYYYIIFKGGSPEYSLYTPLENGKVTLIYRSTLQEILGNWKFWEVVRCLNIQGNRYIEGRYIQVWLYDKVKRNKINDGLGGWWILRTDWLEHWQSNCARHYKMITLTNKDEFWASASAAPLKSKRIRTSFLMELSNWY